MLGGLGMKLKTLIIVKVTVSLYFSSERPAQKTKLLQQNTLVKKQRGK